MKLFKNLIGNKKGFTLMEAIMTTALVTIAATMAAGVFTSSARVNSNQRSVNAGQSDALSSAQSSLASGSSGAGDEFVMTPVGSGGFGALKNNGAVTARYEVASDMGGNVNYKYFKYDGSGSVTNPAPETGADDPDDEETTENTTVAAPETPETPETSTEEPTTEATTSTAVSYEEAVNTHMFPTGTYSNWNKYWEGMYGVDGWKEIKKANTGTATMNDYLEQTYGPNYNNYWSLYKKYLKAGGDPANWQAYWDSKCR